MRRFLLLLFAGVAFAGACPLMQWHGTGMTWNGQAMTWGPQCLISAVSESLVLADRGTGHAAHGALVSESLVLADRGTGHAAHGALVSESLVLADRVLSVRFPWAPILTADHYAIYLPQITFVVVKQ